MAVWLPASWFGQLAGCMAGRLASCLAIWLSIWQEFDLFRFVVNLRTMRPGHIYDLLISLNVDISVAISYVCLLKFIIS